MRVLTNFPFEMFGPRESFPFARIVTFGPPEGRRVGRDRFLYDIPFEPAAGTLDELFAALPPDFEPDLLWFWWPDQEPLPRGLERCPVPVVASISDYNLTLPHLTRLWPFFDLVLTDRPGLQVLGRLPFARVEPFCQFSYRPDVHRIYEDDSGQPLPRDIDLCFVGNLNPIVQRERMAWIERLRAFEGRWRVHIGTAEQGEPYGRLLARSRIVFNRSIRGEINLRTFEAAAAGALVLVERENLEVRDYFAPGREIVLYGPDDLEATIEYYLEHEDERAAIARAGRERALSWTLAEHCRRILPVLASLDPSRRPQADARDLVLGRANAQLPARLVPGAFFAELEAALARRPRDARLCNTLAVAEVHFRAAAGDAARWIDLLECASLAEPDFVPPRLNLAFLARHLGDEDALRALRAQLDLILARRPPLSAYDGLVLPLGFNSHQVSFAGAYAEALRRADTAPLEDWARRTLAAGGRPGPNPALSPLAPAATTGRAFRT